MFTAALITVAKTRNLNKCPLTDEWMRKMWIKKIYIYIMEYNLYIYIKWSITEP